MVVGGNNKIMARTAHSGGYPLLPLLKSYYVLFSCWTDWRYVRYRLERVLGRRTQQLDGKPESKLAAATSLPSPEAHVSWPAGVEVDIVYLWVSGDDPDFRARRDRYAASLGRVVSPTVHTERHLEVDELRYSLRSVELFAPWIRRIFIVTDNQVPTWLDTSNERVTVVNQNEIFPNPDWLPNYNSAAIESQIHLIPGLSEYYLTANDDTFLGKPVFPQDFFQWAAGGEGKEGLMLKVMNDPGNQGWIEPWHRLSDYHQQLWISEWNAARWALEWRNPFFRLRKLDSHQIHGMTKTIQAATVRDFHLEYVRTSSMHFRDLDNLSILRLARQSALLTGAGVAAWVDSTVFSSELAIAERTLASLPPLFCVNSNAADREVARDIYERIYPNKSSFEIG